jgi:hypothetical protein
VAVVVVAAAAGQDFSVREVQSAFRKHTGIQLVRFRAASTPEVASLRTRPHNTARFGEFQLFVLRPGRVGPLRRVFKHGKAPDRRGVYWVPDQAGGWIAVTLYERNVVLAWFPGASTRQVDARWRRLQSAVATFAKRKRR